MKYRLLLIKRWIEDILMYPLILLGRLLALFRPLAKEYRTFFFFSFYHTGGAEKVHLNITKAIGGSDCIIFFTRKSGNDHFYQAFADTGCELKDISRYTDNKWLYFINIIFRGVMSGYINHQKTVPLVFNGQCNFGYKISPWIRSNIPQVELIHSICSFSYIRIPFLPFITRTVMISTIRIQEHLEIYKQYGIPQELSNRIKFIMNGIDLPPFKPVGAEQRKPFTVLYVGRGTPEKRVHLAAQIAAAVKQKRPSIHFRFLGDVQEAIPTNLHRYCEFLGNQNDPAIIEKAYREASVLLLVSDTEGFPLVIMEAMAHGLAVVSTGVGEIPLHVKNEISGFVITNYRDEEAVITEAAQSILRICEEEVLRKEIAAYNLDYAYRHFSLDRFRDAYRLLTEEAFEAAANRPNKAKKADTVN